MHNAICHCPKCRQRDAEGFEILAFILPGGKRIPQRRALSGSPRQLAAPVTGRWRRRGNRIVLMR